MLDQHHPNAPAVERSAGHTFELLSDAWLSLANLETVSIASVPTGVEGRSLLLVELGDPALPAISICAGVHGDERAAPWALLDLVRSGLLDPAFSYRLWPCTNPSGYAAGTRLSADGTDINRSYSDPARTPEARAVVVANRGRRFALALDLHEDFEARGFYCYEQLSRPDPVLVHPVVSALETAGLALQEFGDGFDFGYASDGMHPAMGRGFVLSDPVRERLAFDGWPFSVYAISTCADRAMTFETPMTRPWGERIAMHRTAVVAAIARLRALTR